MWWFNSIAEGNAKQKKYLLQAMYAWMEEEALKPHLLILQPKHSVLGVPETFLQKDYLILNIAPQAVHQLEFSEESIQFHTRFSGQSHHVVVALGAVKALTAAESGQGIEFEVEESILKVHPETQSEVPPRRTLKKVK